MGRPLRAAEGGNVYHVLNRANARMTIFRNNDDYGAFKRILTEAVKRTEDWRWSSLYRWLRGSPEDSRLLSAWPLPRAAGWLDHVNSPQTAAELAALRRCVHRGSPFGNDSWTGRTIRSLALESTIRPRGRPRKPTNGS